MDAEPSILQQKNLSRFQTVTLQFQGYALDVRTKLLDEKCLIQRQFQIYGNSTGVPDSIRQFLIINKQPSIDKERYFPIFPCVVGLIGY
jgi:hypothetical protein